MTDMIKDHIRARVGADQAGQRLDKAAAQLFEGLSRARIQALIAEGHLRLNGAVEQNAAHKLKGGEEIELGVPEVRQAHYGPEDIPLDIRYEDADLLVVNKPAGLVAHPAPGHHGGTLVNALLAHCKGSLSGIGGVERPGIVHRLDKETSGLMVVAKNDAAHRHLAEQFAAHSIERAYLALVWGRPTPLVGRIEKPMGRHSQDRKKMAVVSEKKGKYAATRYRVEQVFGPAEKPLASAVTCELETGRTHQVRVHMASIGHPLIGDPVYGRGRKYFVFPDGRKFNRQALHAKLLAFTHPATGARLKFEAELPYDLEGLMECLADRSGEA